jgi:hypothetical protein
VEVPATADWTGLLLGILIILVIIIIIFIFIIRISSSSDDDNNNASVCVPGHWATRIVVPHVDTSMAGASLPAL